jgi:hypothetical protein
MITRNEIKPDFATLQKYLNGGLSLEGLNGFWFDHFEGRKQEFNRYDFEDLLTEYDLTRHLSDLYVFAWWHSEAWEGYNRMRENFRNHKPHWAEQYNNDLQSLKTFLEDNECTEIIFSSKTDNPTAYRSGKDKVTVKILSIALIDELLCQIDFNELEGKFVPWLRNYSDEYLQKENKPPEALIESFVREKFEPDTQGNHFPRQQSFIKEFYKSLRALREYLRYETKYIDTAKPDSEVYNFIERLCEIIGIYDLPELRKYIK